MDYNLKKITIMKLIKKDYLLLIIVLLPFIYLASIWNSLPESVPIHWDGNGEIDGYESKYALLLIPLVLPFLTYLLFTYIPKIDPKGKISAMGKKYENIKFLLVLFMSFLALFIIYSSKSQTVTNPNILFILLGMLFTVLGNYMKTIKPNYFIGIKTPWTLENEDVWKSTHRLGGKLWFIGGLLIILLSLILDKKMNTIFFIIIICMMSIIPIVYSYLEFKKAKKQIPHF